MSKLSSLPTLLATGLLLAGSLVAQRPPLPGLPLISPPVNHPALAGQPLMDANRPSRPARGGPKVLRNRPRVDPATSGVKKSGNDLKKAIKKVADLPWHDGRRALSDALRESKQTGRPVLLLQTLGDIDGFA